MANGNNNNGGALSQMDALIDMSDMDFEMSQIWGSDWKEQIQEQGGTLKSSGQITSLGDLNKMITSEKHIKPTILNKLMGKIEEIIPGGKTGERGKDSWLVEGAFPWANIDPAEGKGYEQGTKHFKTTGRGGNWNEAYGQAFGLSQR